MPVHTLNLMQCGDLRFQSQMSRIAILLISLQHIRLSGTEVTVITRWPGLVKHIQSVGLVESQLLPKGWLFFVFFLLL